jgi:4-hydroxy-tetrahydrodipicolinate synthase
MAENLPVRGVYCAAATPLNADLTPDLAAFTTHCHTLLDEGCHGVALLGTTGEANSFASEERRAILEAALEAGIAPGQLMPGTGCCAIPDTVALTRHALSLGVTQVVMLPPFYYKGATEDGLFAGYADTIERIGDDRLRVVLYHIPQMSGIPLSLALIARLIQAFPKVVVGIKDSGGEFANMRAVIEAFPGFSVLAGADPLMLPLLEAGGAGCITATSNLVASELATVFGLFADATRKAEVTAAQERIVALRTLSNRYAQIPTIKAMVAAKSGYDGWHRTRPPLVPLTAAQRAEIGAAFKEATV